MNKNIIAIILLGFIVVFSAGIVIGSSTKQDRLAQELCKYAEYDFCKVSSYEIFIKRK